MKRKVLIFTLIISFILSLTAHASIYEEKSQKVLSRGVTLTTLKTYLKSGWQNINIIEADLSDKYINADSILPEDGISSLENIKSMAEKYNTLVAVNADFFARSGNSGNAGSPIGPVVKDHTLLTSTHDVPDVMATFSITDKENILINYETTSIKITAPNGEEIYAKHLNKYDSLMDICVYTKDFKDVTDGSFNNILEMVVEDGTVTEMRFEQEGVTVPENGYVIRHLPEYNSFLTDNFQVGDKIDITIETTIDLEKVKTALGGGTKLIEKGEIAPITHDVSGANPRTVAGTDETGTKLYLITIDGRRNNAKGMTLTETAEFLKSYGIYEAINFDGGGSTTLVTNKGSEQSVSNLLSDGSLRRVSNGLGIFSTAPKGKFSGFNISCDNKTILNKTSREFFITDAFDQYNNFIETPKGHIKWSVDSSYGYFKENVFYPEKTGENIKISCALNGKTAYCHVDVIGTPEKISISPAHFSKRDISSADFITVGYDNKGKSAVIDSKDVLVTDKTSGDVGTFKVTAAGVSAVGSFSPENTIDFEKKNFSSATYPAEYVSGKASLSGNLKRSGKSGAELVFDFTKFTLSTKASYLVLDTPLKTDGRKNVGVWVYSPGPSKQMIKAEFRNSENEFLSAVLTDSVDFTGWKYLKASVPETAETLTRLYVVQNETPENTKGFVAFDDLSLFNSGNIDFDEISEKYSAVESKGSANCKTFIVTGALNTGNTLLTKVLKNKLENKLKDINAYLYYSLDNIKFDNLNVNTINGYKSSLWDNNLFITLNNSDRYISTPQYVKFAEDLKSTDAENVFVMMNEDFSLMTSTDDLFLLKTLLNSKAEKSNVYVFFSNGGDKMYKENNITFIGVKGLINSNPKNIMENKDEFSYVRAEITDDKVNITFEKVL